MDCTLPESENLSCTILCISLAKRGDNPHIEKKRLNNRRALPYHERM